MTLTVLEMKDDKYIAKWKIMIIKLIFILHSRILHARPLVEAISMLNILKYGNPTLNRQYEIMKEKYFKMISFVIIGCSIQV